MKDYYDNLYDINFFSQEKYESALASVSIQVLNPGRLLWETWKCSGLKVNEAKAFYLKNFSNFNIDNFTTKLEKNPEEVSILLLLICEEAYRKDDEILFNKCYSILSTLPFQNIRLKALKLNKAFNAMKQLSEKLMYTPDSVQTRIEKIQNHALNYLNNYGNKFSMRDIKVEIPVKNDWNKRNMNFKDKMRVKDFYQTTSSYVLELLAANHQVETLFNYSLILEKLLELGVTSIYDYAGGIGTFSLLAISKGIQVIFSELDSVTRNYAIQRFTDMKCNIPINIIEYDNPDVERNLECIVCTEVLEHIYEPELLIEYFSTKLKNNGILVISESFDYTEDFCTHIPKHKGKGGNVFIDYMEKENFELITLQYPTHPIIFRKK